MTSATKLAFTKTKTTASTATVALPAVAVAELRRHHVQQVQDRLKANAWADPDLVFTTSLGTPLEARNVRRELQRTVAAAGLGRRVRLHDLRHTAASSLMAEGIGMEVTSKLLAGAVGAALDELHAPDHADHSDLPAPSVPQAALPVRPPRRRGLLGSVPNGRRGACGDGHGHRPAAEHPCAPHAAGGHASLTAARRRR